MKAIVQRGLTAALSPVFGAALVTACAGMTTAEKNQRLADIKHRICVNELHSNRGVQALQACMDAHDLDPKHAENHYVLGFIYQGRQMWEKSIEHYKKATELKPKFSEARNNLATVYIDLGRFDEALVELEKALENVVYATPDIAHANIGWIHFKKGKSDLAIKHLRTSLFTNPKSCKALNNLGAVYDSLGKHDEARRNLELAVQHCPKYGEAHYRLGLTYVRLERRQDAKASFARCIEYLPQTSFGRECEKYAKLLE